jgi:hypothetical protein
MTWYTFTLTIDQIAQHKIYFSAGCPDGFALFEPKTNRLGQHSYMMSPIAAKLCSEILREYNATVCTTPSRNLLGNPLGDENGLDFI